MSVSALNPGGKIDRGALAQLAADDNLEHFVIVSFFKDDNGRRLVTTGWSAGMFHSDLIYASAKIEDAVTREVFGR